MLFKLKVFKLLTLLFNSKTFNVKFLNTPDIKEIGYKDK